MVLDADTCYRAMVSRDRRFEGSFVTAVKTTGVYCRPGCPARVPRRENVIFFGRAAVAEERGFRPCMRCRPDAAPGSPVVAGTSATVARALRMIDAGAIENGEGVGALAERLGVGERHLRRLFAEQVGASPLSVALTRRLHFARQLLDDTRLPMAEVALAAGFHSVRRFNDAMRRNFRRTPGQLRKAKEPRSDEILTLRLPFRAPYDWDSLSGFLSARATPGVEIVDGRGYRRTTVIDGRPTVIAVRPVEEARHLVLEIHGVPTRGLFDVVARARALFDLAADPTAIGADLARDRKLAPLVAARPGLRVPGAWDPFELVVRAILGQQVSVRGATTLAGRLAERFGRVFASGEPGLTRIFPDPERLAKADLSSLGMPKARGAAIVQLARAVCDRPALLDTPEGLTDLPGIGPWTAACVAMRAHHEPDAFPAGDLGLRRALSLDGEAAVARLSEKWRPFRAYAAMHLWMKGAR